MNKKPFSLIHLQNNTKYKNIYTIQSVRISTESILSKNTNSLIAALV